MVGFGFRTLLLACVLFTGFQGLSAQLSVRSTSSFLPIKTVEFITSETFAYPPLSAFERQPVTGNRQPIPFDFTRTAPHLAFFCRLEINEKAGNIIPAKFRLGGHRHWQDNLSKR